MKTILGGNPESRIKTRLLLVVFLAGLTFMLLAISVQFQAITIQEISFLWWLYGYHNGSFDQIAQLLAYLGGMPAILVTALLVSAIAFFKQRSDFIWFTWAACLGAISIGWLGKAGFSRLRPLVWQQTVPFYGDSFPSNHSLYAITLAGLLLVMLFNTRWRATAFILGLLWSTVMGISRLYLGAHFPTDVLAGWSLGMAWLGLLCWLFIHFGLFRLSPFQSNQVQHRASRFAGNHEV